MFSVIAMNGFSPMAVGSLRVVFASVFLLVALKVFNQSLVKSLSHWKFVTIYGTAFSTLPFLALPWALQFVSSSAAAISFASITFTPPLSPMDSLAFFFLSVDAE